MTRGLRIPAGVVIVGAVAVILMILFAVSIFGWDDQARGVVFWAGWVIAVAAAFLGSTFLPLVPSPEDDDENGGFRGDRWPGDGRGA